jgi:hypothetical protein
MSIFAKFNQEMDKDLIQQEINEASANSFEDVPVGKYEVAVTRLEVKPTKNGDKVMITCTFKILDGQYKGRLIFFNQVIMTGFQIHMANQFLRSLDTGEEIEFKDYDQYSDMVKVIDKVIQVSELEYGLEYSKSDKGYDQYKITDVYEG